MSRRDWCVVRLCESKVTKRRRLAQERAGLREREELARSRPAPVPTAAHVAAAEAARKRAFTLPPPGFRRVYSRDGSRIEPIPGWTP